MLSCWAADQPRTCVDGKGRVLWSRARGKGPCGDSGLAVGLRPVSACHWARKSGHCTAGTESLSAIENPNGAEAGCCWLQGEHPSPSLLWLSSPLSNKWFDGDQERKTLRSHRPADSIDEVGARMMLAAPAHAARRGCRPRVARVPQSLKGRQNSDF